MPDRSAFAGVSRFAGRGAALLLALTWLAGPPGPLHAQDQRAITVEWIYSDEGEEPGKIPRFAWTSGGEVLLLDTRKPKKRTDAESG